MYLELHNQGLFPPAYGKARSPKQLELMSWYRTPLSTGALPKTLVANGSARSGKTYPMGVDFIMAGMFQFDKALFLMIGESIDTLRTNVVDNLINIIGTSPAFGMKCQLNLKDKRLVVERPVYADVGGKRTLLRWVKNTFKMYGGSIKGAEGKIQGSTASGVFFDDATLIRQEVFNQATLRCRTVKNSLFWLNCNAGPPTHWIKKDLIDKADEKGVRVIYFNALDNPVMDYKMIHELQNSYSGLFKKRFIENEWAIASGSIYSLFALEPERYRLVGDVPHFERVNIGVDFGLSRSKHGLVATGILPNKMGIVSLAAEAHDPETMNTGDVDAMVVNFAKKISHRYGRVNSIECDHVGVLINSIRTALRKEGLHIPIDGAYKAKIIDRIKAKDRLLATNAYKYIADECKPLEHALIAAVWNPDQDGVRLDDGSNEYYDVLDASEYSWGKYVTALSSRDLTA